MINSKLIKNELDGLSEGWIVLLETTAEKSLEVSLLALKILTDGKYTGTILSTSRPCSNLLSIYEKQKIDTSKLFILDCVCKSQGINVKNIKNVFHLENISALTNISLAINDNLKKMSRLKRSFIFIDSITTMLIHNKADVYARFIHNILTKMRINKVNGLLISLKEETNKEVRAEIAQLCDKVINV